jgi:hypothetical protein
VASSSQAILSNAIDNIRGKIANLRELGFTDPVKMITSSPAILELAIDNIRGKIAELRELGFGDTVKMVTPSPAILRYAKRLIKSAARSPIYANLDLPTR